MVGTYIAIMVVLIILSAYFSATETAFSSLNRTRIKTMAEKGNKKAVLAYELSEKYDKLISTILIGNNVVNIATASIGTILFVKLCGAGLGATVSTVVVTIVVLIFGEISPKSIAKDCPERFAMFSAPIIRMLIIIFTPLNYLFTQWKKLLSKLFKLETDTKMSQEELLMLVNEVQQDGSIDKNEGELLKNAIEFSEQEAGDILTHRVDLEGIDIKSDKKEIAQKFTQSRYSRLLVYEQNIDNIVGVIHQKDFYVGDGITDKDIKELITPVIYVLYSEKISVILRHLQKRKTHVAIVLDEFGGTFGIVTMEDILEELVGEIWDEHDEVIENFRKTESGSYIVDGSLELDDFCSFFGFDTDSEMVSLSGWVMEYLGHVAKEGESFDYSGYRIKILKAEGHRVTMIEVEKL